MNFIKKQTIGNWLTLAALVFALISAIIYGVNVGSAGYFKGRTSEPLVAATVIAILFAAAILVLSSLKFKGIVGKVLDIVIGAMKILVAVLLIFALLQFVATRVEGLGFIYFSNADVIQEVQTPANLASASTAVTGFVFYGIAWLIAVVAAFFGFRKKNAD